MAKLFSGQLEDLINSSTTWSPCRGLPAATGLGRAEEPALGTEAALLSKEKLEIA